MVEASLILVGSLALLIGFWYWQANKPWAERVTGRRIRGFGENPESVQEVVRFVREAPGTSSSLTQALRVPSSDPETERLRVLTYRRLFLFTGLIPSVLIVFVAADIAELALPNLDDASTAVIAVLWLALLVLGILVVRLALDAYRYGNGAAISIGRLVIDALAAFAMLGVIVLAILAA